MVKLVRVTTSTSHSSQYSSYHHETMAESQATPAQPNGAPRGQSRQGRRGRPSRNRGGRSRGGPQAGGRSRATDAAGPESAAADAAPEKVPANAGESARGGRGSRGRRGARQPRGNRDRGHRTAFGTQRTFGGRLTEAPTDESGETASLNADAPAFVPGQPVSVGT